VQKWRKPSNPISQGKLLTKELSPTAFQIGIDDVNKSVNEVVKLIKSDKNFAVLMPISVTSEIARLENVDGERCHDLELAKKVSVMSKITLASSAEVWLINLPGEPFNHFYSNDMEGLVQEVFLASYEEIKRESRIVNAESEEHSPVNTVIMDSFPITRSSRRLNPSVSEPQEIRDEPNSTHADWVSIQTNPCGTSNSLRRQALRITRDKLHSTNARARNDKMDQCPARANT
jgi:hypothetical protein